MSLLIGLTGCPVADDRPAKQKPLTVAPPDAIKLLVIGDTEIGPKLVRQWKAHQDGQLSVENQSQAEWIKAGFPISDGTDLICLLYTSPSPRDRQKSRMPSSA